MHAAYWALGLAILLEVVGTTALQMSEQFQRFWPTLGMLLCYGGAFYGLSLALKAIPIGIAYAVWSGVGIIAISLIGRLFFAQRLDGAALFGIGLIVAGVLVIHLFSEASPH